MKNPPRHRSHYIIDSFEARALKKRPLIVKIADFLTSRFGSVSFLVLNILGYGFWIMINTGRVPGFPVIDPFPFPFLNSFVSLEAIALTIIVLMSQNRENQRDILRNELGLQVELISEKELTKILSLLREILESQKKIKHDPELIEMTKEIDAGYIERELEHQLGGTDPIGEIADTIKEKINNRR